MIVSILQSLISLLLAGVFCYTIFTHEWAKGKKQTQQALLGLLFGGLVFVLGMNSIVLEPFVAPFDAKSGPLIFAGYLGGPIGAAIVAICCWLYQLSMGGPSTFIEVFMTVALPAVGLGAGYLRPPRDWPSTRVSGISRILGLYALLNIVLFVYLSMNGTGPDPVLAALLRTLGFMIVGCLSILLTWQIVNYAIRAANSANRNTDLVKQLNLAMRASGMGMFVQDVGKPEFHVDEGMLAIYGIERPSGVISLAEFNEAVHPDDRDRVQSEVQKAWENGDVMNRVNFRGIRSDGTILHIRSNWIVERDADGAALRVTGVNADLTDIIETEQKQRDTANRLSMIVEKLPGVIFENDATDRHKSELLYISPKCVDFWGYTDQELYANPMLFFQAHEPEDIPVFLAALENSLATGTPVVHRYRVTTRDGQKRWLDFHGEVSNEDGRVRTKAIVLDVTREVEAQEQVAKEREISIRAQKNESIGQLTGGVAHDFNNLLAVILGNLELLEDEDEPSQQHELIDAAKVATLRGADLTRNMLAFARQAPLVPKVLDINHVVREARNWIGRTLPESVDVETSLLAGLWPVKADRTSLESALLNLILNARDAMKGQGKLTIETANLRIDEAYLDSRQEEIAAGRYVMLAVSDTGPGIPDDILGSIFEPFFTTKPPGVGSGLGLAMTVGFMRQSGGTVQVYTEIGEGTAFKLYFPVSKDLSGPQGNALVSRSTVYGGGRRLLIAEDEQAVRETLVTILERAGYNVTATTTGDEAFATFVADPNFDVLLTDIVMPGKLQGTHLANALREQWPDLPVLFMSGYASEATVHGNGLRAEDIRLMKPVQRADLLSAIVKALEG